METNIRKCIECGDTIHGRSDRKFCSDSCRNAYNNKYRSDINSIMRNTNNALRKNRKILFNQVTNNKTRITKDKLATLGFNFNFFTHIYTTKKNVSYFYCYDYGYTFLESNLCLVVKDINEDRI